MSKYIGFAIAHIKWRGNSPSLVGLKEAFATSLRIYCDSIFYKMSSDSTTK